MFGRLLLAASVGLLLASSTRWIDTAAGAPVLQGIQGMAPATILAAVPVALLALWLLRGAGRLRFVAGIVVLLAAADLATALLTQPREEAPASQGTKSVTVLSANVLDNNADELALLDKARALDADVLVLIEAGTEFVAALDALGADELYPHRVVSETLGPQATSLLSRVPFRRVEGPELTFETVTVRLERGVAAGVTVAAVHPTPPLHGLAEEWLDDQARIATWAERRRGPLVVAGDFNAGATHPTFRRLCDDGPLDGCGGTLATPTWRIGAGPFLLRLDHVLSLDLEVADDGLLTIDGTDHRAVWKQFVLP